MYIHICLIEFMIWPLFSIDAYPAGISHKIKPIQQDDDSVGTLKPLKQPCPSIQHTELNNISFSKAVAKYSKAKLLQGTIIGSFLTFFTFFSFVSHKTEPKTSPGILCNDNEYFGHATQTSNPGFAQATLEPDSDSQEMSVFQREESIDLISSRMDCSDNMPKVNILNPNEGEKIESSMLDPNKDKGTETNDSPINETKQWNGNEKPQILNSSNKPISHIENKNNETSYSQGVIDSIPQQVNKRGQWAKQQVTKPRNSKLFVLFHESENEGDLEPRQTNSIGDMIEPRNAGRCFVQSGGENGSLHSECMTDPFNRHDHSVAKDKIIEPANRSKISSPTPIQNNSSQKRKVSITSPQETRASILRKQQAREKNSLLVVSAMNSVATAKPKSVGGSDKQKIPSLHEKQQVDKTICYKETENKRSSSQETNSSDKKSLKIKTPKQNSTMIINIDQELVSHSSETTNLMRLNTDKDMVKYPNQPTTGVILQDQNNETESPLVDLSTKTDFVEIADNDESSGTPTMVWVESKTKPGTFLGYKEKCRDVTQGRDMQLNLKDTVAVEPQIVEGLSDFGLPDKWKEQDNSTHKIVYKYCGHCTIGFLHPYKLKFADKYKTATRKTIKQMVMEALQAKPMEYQIAYGLIDCVIPSSMSLILYPPPFLQYNDMHYVIRIISYYLDPQKKINPFSISFESDDGKTLLDEKPSHIDFGNDRETLEMLLLFISVMFEAYAGALNQAHPIPYE